MKFLCEGCERLATPAGFRVVEGTLELTCSSCGRVASVPGLPERPGPVAAERAASGRAPAAPVAPAAAVAPSSATDPGAAPNPAADEGWLATRWEFLTATWDDPTAHDRLIAEAAVRDQLAQLGRRYSDRLAKDPADTAASRAREELLRRATARLMAELPRQEAGLTQDHARQVRNVAMVLVLLAIAAFGLYVVLHGGLSGGAR